MSRPIFTSRRGEFDRKNAAFIDMVQGRMAMDVEIGIKTTAGTPVSATKAMGNKRGGGGHMKSEARHFKTADGRWRVEVDKVYARSQELGIVNGHPVRRYSTPGTSAGWFKRAIDGVLRNRVQYIHEAKTAVGL